MEQYWIWLSSVDGIGAKRFYRLLSQYGDARGVWDNIGDGDMTFLGPKTLKTLRAARTEGYFFRLFAEMERTGMRAVTRISAGYPQALNEIHDPPPTLYVRGEAPLDAERMFAIVGSRRATRDGKRAAREFAAALARENVCVVSGLARGVDTCAHEGALEGGGATIAVLGSGADVIYPPENEELAARILDAGGAIISEYAPGTRPSQGTFPARNRIISGLCARRAAGGGFADLRGDDHRQPRRRAGTRRVRRARLHLLPAQRRAQPPDLRWRESGAVGVGHPRALSLGRASGAKCPSRARDRTG